VSQIQSYLIPWSVILSDEVAGATEESKEPYGRQPSQIVAVPHRHSVL